MVVERKGRGPGNEFEKKKSYTERVVDMDTFTIKVRDQFYRRGKSPKGLGGAVSLVEGGIIQVSLEK